MSQRDSVIHLVAGGVAGTVGAIVTCPLEVVKTRQQSSQGGFYVPPIAQDGDLSSKTTCRSICHGKRMLWTSSGLCGPPQYLAPLSGWTPTTTARVLPRPPQTHSPTLIQCLLHIVKYEGPMGLFKGLGPNLVGVAPSRAIYFATYSQAKQFWNGILPPDAPIVHVFSASCAGFVASTATNPIWFVKTRLQLDVNQQSNMTTMECIRRIYAKSGVLGFYKGITASYIGISETIVHFVIYEAIKAELLSQRQQQGSAPSDESGARHGRDFVEFMMAGAVSKTIASCIAYPHEVVRTRLREEGNKYSRFWQTFALVYREEGIRGLYRGLGTQLIRQIPNTAIMMATYEAVVYILSVRMATETTTNTRVSAHHYHQNGTASSGRG